LFDAEMNIQALESSIAIVSSGLGFQGSTIDRLETELGEFRSLLDIVNQIGPQLQQRRTEEASFIETLVARDNGRFNVVCEQIQRKAEGLHLSRLRSMEVIGDLLDWFRETESHLREDRTNWRPDLGRGNLQNPETLPLISKKKSIVVHG